MTNTAHLYLLVPKFLTESGNKNLSKHLSEPFKFLYATNKNWGAVLKIGMLPKVIYQISYMQN